MTPSEFLEKGSGSAERAIEWGQAFLGSGRRIARLTKREGLTPKSSQLSFATDDMRVRRSLIDRGGRSTRNTDSGQRDFVQRRRERANKSNRLAQLLLSKGRLFVAPVSELIPPAP